MEKNYTFLLIFSFLSFIYMCMAIVYKEKLIVEPLKIGEIMNIIKNRRQRKELKVRLMADYVEATQIPNIYKVVFVDRSGEGYDKYNLYDAKENFYLFNRCKTTLQHLKYGLYFVREYDISTGLTAGIFDVSSNRFVFPKRPSLNIRQFPNGKSDTVLLQTNNELIVYNLKTKLVESTIGI